MKYLKEVCEECGTIKETEIYSMRNNSIITFKKLMIILEAPKGYYIKKRTGYTKSLCPECSIKSEKEFEQLIKKSKYFEYDDLEIF